MVPKLFGPIRERYLERTGGYTRVLRIEPIKEDQAPSAILQLVDGPKDIRFAMTAKTIAHLRQEEKPINEITAANIAKVTRYRGNGEQELEELVEKFERLSEEDLLGLNREPDEKDGITQKKKPEKKLVEEPKKRRVYPNPDFRPKKARNTQN